MRKRLLVALALAALAAPLIAGCGDKTVTETASNGQVTTRTVPNVRFARTKFLLHSGLAFGAIRRWIYKPAQQGAFAKGADGRTKAIAKALAAGTFSLNELRLARNAALSDDKLRPLADKLAALIDQAQAALKTLGAGGTPSAADLLGIGAGLAGIKTLAGSLGAPITEQVPPTLG